MKMHKVFFEVHSEMPRQGPGDNESTRKAYLMLQHLPEMPHILDVGCGPGMQTLELARLSHGKIIALDFHQPFLDALEQQAKLEGLSEIITTVKGDMSQMEFQKESFDVIWAEGSIYIIGFEKGLLEWKQFLKKNGYLVASEIVWLKSHPPEEVRAFFSKECPLMATIEENLTIVKNTGYRLVGYFVLPEESWWKDYYTPIERKIPSLKLKYRDDEEALGTLACEETEIELFRKYSAYYGYVFFICQLNQEF